MAAIKRILHDKFFMTDMGPLHFFLGLEISHNALGIKLSHLLERFHMTNYKSAPTPFLYVVKLKDARDTPLVDRTLYRKLVESFVVFYTL